MGKRYNQLSVDERNQIQRGLNAGQSLRALARSMNRGTGKPHPSDGLLCRPSQSLAAPNQ